MTTHHPQDLLPLLTVTEAALHAATDRTVWGGCTDCHATFSTERIPLEDDDPEVRAYTVLIAHDDTCPWLAGLLAANATVATDDPEEEETNEARRHAC